MSEPRIGVCALPECRDRWEGMDSSQQEQALNLATTAWQAPGHRVVGDIPDELVQEMQGAGVIEKADDGWRFIPAEMLFYLKALGLISYLKLAARPAAEVLQELKSLLVEAATARDGSFRDARQLAAFAFAVLVNQFHRVDILTQVASGNVPEHGFWDYYHYACSALPVLEVGAQSLSEIMVALERQAGTDLAGASAYTASEEIGRLRPDFALELVFCFVDSIDEISAGFVEKLLTGIARSSSEGLDTVRTTCDGWLDSDDGLLCQAAITCATSLVLADLAPPNWLVARVDSLAVRSDAVRYSLAIAVTQLGASLKDLSAWSLGALSKLKSIGPRDSISHAIAVVLGRAPSETPDDYRLSCLDMLTDVPLANKGTVKLVNQVLSSFAPVQVAAVWKYLERWILAHDTAESVAEHDMFLYTLQELHSHDPALGTKVLTQWFSHEDLRLVEEARSILGELESPIFGAETICSMTPDLLVYVTEKLLAGRLACTQVIQLFHSILRNASGIEALMSYFLHRLQYLAWNYPNTVGRFLEGVIDEADTSVLSTILRDAKSWLEAYLAQRRDAFVPELMPSKRRVDKYQEFVGKQMQILQDDMFHDDRHPLLSLVAHDIIGRGDRTFHMVVSPPGTSRGRTFSEPSGFGHFSQSIELPRGEVIDPEGEVWRRFLRISRTRGEAHDGD